MTMSKRERKLAARAQHARRQRHHTIGIGLVLCLTAAALLVLNAFTHGIFQTLQVGSSALYVLAKGASFTAAVYAARAGIRRLWPPQPSD